MPSNKQRREAARRKLERQLQAREERARRRRRGNLIASIVGGLAIVGVVIAFIVISSGESSNNAGGSSGSSSAGASDTASPTPSTSYPNAQGAAVTFKGVTVNGAADLAGRPITTSVGGPDPTVVEYQDLVPGTGQSPTATDTVTIQYEGVLYKDGTVFDSSWQRGEPATFSLTGVIEGFTKSIAGDPASNIPAMKVGGRRVVIIPAALGYGATAQGSIPANSTLVFVIDLLSVTAGSAAPSS